MIRLPALLVLLTASWAGAGDAVFFAGTGCRLVLVEGQAHVAEVHCRNRITAGLGTERGRMEAGGIGVGVAIVSTSEPVIGQSPDVFSFEPDPGYFVDPPDLVIDEHGADFARVFVWSGV